MGFIQSEFSYLHIVWFLRSTMSMKFWQTAKHSSGFYISQKKLYNYTSETEQCPCALSEKIQFLYNQISSTLCRFIHLNMNSFKDAYSPRCMHLDNCTSVYLSMDTSG